ncbi:hypothetical protein ACVBEJ_13925 [Porticoccus sp. GXU_MW_L64]
MGIFFKQKHFTALAMLFCFLLIPIKSNAEDNSALGRYLDCLNQHTKDSKRENNNQITDATKILEACSKQRQAVLDSLPRETALNQLRQIEYHLKGREATAQTNNPEKK